MTTVFKVKNFDVLIDDIDADLLDLQWYANNEGSNSYVRRTERGRQNEKLHRVIMARILGRPLRKGELVDHKDANPFNNQRGNLRLATKAQNAANSRAYKTNKLGVKGVYVSSSGRFGARIKVDGKDIHLGKFDTIEEARAAYCEAAKKYFGDFARW